MELEHRIDAFDDQQGFTKLRHFIQDKQIEIATLYPFVSCDRAPESDNTALDAVAKNLARLADEMSISIEVNHHVRKPAHGEADMFTVHDSRGAVALTNAARAVRVLNRMTAGDAALAGVADRRGYVRIDDGKPNYAAPEPVEWYELRSETPRQLRR